MAAPAEWAPVQRVPTYELVLRRIEEQLINRTLRPGDRLPPEREFAAALGASRPAVREALRVLQAQGVLRSAVGTGADSGTIVTPAPSGALTRLLRVHLAVASFPLSDVVEARVMLERFSALGAVKAITPEFLARIEAPLLAMDDAGHRPGPVQRAGHRVPCRDRRGRRQPVRRRSDRGRAGVDPQRHPGHAGEFRGLAGDPGRAAGRSPRDLPRPRRRRRAAGGRSVGEAHRGLLRPDAGGVVRTDAWAGARRPSRPR